MKIISIEVSEQVAADLQRYQDRAQEVLQLGMTQLRLQEALHLYRQQLISIGRAAELAGISRQEMVRHARAAGLAPHHGAEMVQAELERDPV